MPYVEARPAEQGFRLSSPGLCAALELPAGEVLSLRKNTLFAERFRAAWPSGTPFLESRAGLWPFAREYEIRHGGATVASWRYAGQSRLKFDVTSPNYVYCVRARPGESLFTTRRYFDVETAGGGRIAGVEAVHEALAGGARHDRVRVRARAQQAGLLWLLVFVTARLWIDLDEAMRAGS